VAFSSSSPAKEQVQEEVIHLLQQSTGQGSGISSPNSFAELFAKMGYDHGTGGESSIHRDDEKKNSVQPTVTKGTDYQVSNQDLSGGEGRAWKNIAQQHGIMSANLQQFNQHVLSVAKDPKSAKYGPVLNLAG